MTRVLTFGNSGSGKSTLTKQLQEHEGLAHLDLDTLARKPHKYDSKAAQDANLAMLIDWIGQYPDRNDTFLRSAHQALYANYPGDKRTITENLAAGGDQADDYAASI